MAKIESDRLEWEKIKWEAEREHRIEMARKEAEREERKLRVAEKESNIRQRMDLLKTAMEKEIISKEEAMRILSNLMNE
jgi:hypothetical protein